MGSITMTVPPEYGETLRRAVVADLDFWTRAIKDEQVELQETREGPPKPEGLPKPDKVDLHYEELTNKHRALTETGALVEQVPTPGTEAEAELEGSTGALVGVTDEAMRICLKDLAHEAGYMPLDGEALRKKMGELDWWITQAATAEAADMNGKGS